MNPAKRVHQILIEARKLATDHPGYSMVGWGQVFDVELKDRNLKTVKEIRIHPSSLHYEVQIEILHRISHLNILVTEVQDNIKKIPDINYSLYLSPFPRLEYAISPARLSDNFASAMAEISDSDLVIIEFCSELLSKNFFEKLIDEPLLKELLNEIHQLYERIKQSDISLNLKEVLLDLLETMRRAIHEYRIRGIKGFEDGLAKILGKLILNRDLIQNSNSDEVKEVGQLWNKFVSLYSFAADSIQVIEGVQKVLPLLPAIIHTMSK